MPGRGNYRTAPLPAPCSYLPACLRLLPHTYAHIYTHPAHTRLALGAPACPRILFPIQAARYMIEVYPQHCDALALVGGINECTNSSTHKCTLARVGGLQPHRDWWSGGLFCVGDLATLLIAQCVLPHVRPVGPAYGLDLNRLAVAHICTSEPGGCASWCTCCWHRQQPARHAAAKRALPHLHGAVLQGPQSRAPPVPQRRHACAEELFSGVSKGCETDMRNALCLPE